MLPHDKDAKNPKKLQATTRVVASYAHDSRHHIGVASLSLTAQAEDLDALEIPARFTDPEEFQRFAAKVAKARDQAKVAGRSARAAIRELGEMMEDMILYMRMGTGEPVPVDMKGLAVGPDLQRVRENLGPRAAEAKAALKVMPSRMQIVTDPRYFRRILYNLIGNSIKHARATKIVVGMRMDGDDCVLEVADNGRGIPEAEQERVFEAGFRGAVAGGDSWAEGRGLGLYIVKSIVELLGGQIELRSKLGKGTRFKVYLPGPIEWQPRGVNASKHEETSLAGRTVAVLEDHTETLRLYEHAFKSRGANVIASEHVSEWVSKVVNAKKVPDLILVDFMIGRGTSDLALTMLRTRLRDALPKSRKKGADGVMSLPIVIVTGNPAHPQLKELSKNIPVLQKPLTQQSIETLTQVAAGKRALNAADFIN